MVRFGDNMTYLHCKLLWLLCSITQFTYLLTKLWLDLFNTSSKKGHGFVTFLVQRLPTFYTKLEPRKKTDHWTSKVLCGDFIFDAVVCRKNRCFLQGTNIIIKQDVMGGVHMFVSNSLWVCFCQELAKSDDTWQNYHKKKKGDVFLWDAVY